MKASKTIHAVRSAHYASGSMVRALCGVVVGENRRTDSRRKVTCKRCRQLLGMTTGPRKPPKRVDPAGSKPLHAEGRRLGRGLAALLGEPPENTYSTALRVLHAEGRALGRGLDALLGEPPENTYSAALRVADAFNAAIYFALDVLGADGGLDLLRLWREGDFDAIRKEFGSYLKDDPKFETLFAQPFLEVVTPPKSIKRSGEWSDGEFYSAHRIVKLEAVYKLASELCDAIDALEEDVGGHRSPREILGELGPAVYAVKGR